MCLQWRVAMEHQESLLTSSWIRQTHKYFCNSQLAQAWSFHVAPLYPPICYSVKGGCCSQGGWQWVVPVVKRKGQGVGGGNPRRFSPWPKSPQVWLWGDEPGMSWARVGVAPTYHTVHRRINPNTLLWSQGLPSGFPVIRTLQILKNKMFLSNIS